MKADAFYRPLKASAELAGLECNMIDGTRVKVDGHGANRGSGVRPSVAPQAIGLHRMMGAFSRKFDACSVGKGVLPLAFQGLVSQQARWSGGNLAHHLPAMRRLKGPRAPRKAAAGAAQRGALFDFGLIPATLLSWCGSGRGSRSLATVATMSVILAFHDIIARPVAGTGS